ncbi:MAG TPA: ATP-binding protein [Candidatus Sulfopaludibacter sp.]|nr:ATP-binding protein [Candidatus Sulfopaludibacter sp.]
MHGASEFPGWVIKAVCGGCILGVGLTAPDVSRAEDQAAVGSSLVTNVIQFSRLGSQNPTVSHFIRLEGDVLWADPAQGKFVLQDASGTEELEMALPGRLQPGQRVRLEGETTIARRGAGVQLGVVGPVVDDDGIHTMIEKSGAVYLQAGRHPIRVDWFNGVEKYGLEVNYQGPALRRQRIPDSALFRTQTDATGATHFVAGLNYACYAVDGEVLPDFDALTPLKTGNVSNFDLDVMLGVMSRNEHVGLQFTGYLQIPRDGLYTFYLTSDDGSQLFIGDQSLRLETIGRIALPEPRQMIIGQTLSESGDYQRVEVEGIITFVSERKDGWDLEITSDTGRLKLKVADGSGLSAGRLLNSRVRVTGVCQSVYNAEGERVGGVLLVSDKREIEIIGTTQPTAENMEVGPGTRRVLTAASEVHQLNREEAQRGYPVEIQGVVTCVLPERQAFTLQDATRGVYVEDHSESRSVPPRIGEYVKVKGKTDPSLFAPIVDADRVENLGAGRMPQPVHPAWEELMNGSLDAQYVELQGIVTSVSTNGVTLFTGDGQIKLELRVVGMKTGELERYEDAVVRVRGCLFASWDYVTHQVKVGEIRVHGAEISVDQPAPTDLFSLPLKTIAELLQFSPQAGVFQRVKVSGQIIYAQAPEYYLMDGNNGLQFILKKPVPGLDVGDQVEVVGFPGLSGASPLLHEAVARKIGRATLPGARKLPADNLIRAEYDSTLVTVDGLLVSVRETPAGQALEMRSGVRTFMARLNTRDDSVHSLAPGSRLKLIGVYLGEGGNRAVGQDITSFELLLNSPADISVLARPPWWTLERLLVMMGVLVCVLAAAALWITQLHRQVEQRTRELGAQIRQRQNVEHQRAMEQERARIAQDLHDELGSGITEISMLAARARSATAPDEKRNHYLEQAREKAREMVTALDEIVWAMNPKHDSLASLVTYFCLYADRFLGLASISWRLEGVSGTSDPMVDSRHRHQLFLAFKEALTNVVRHAGASEVRLSIQAEQGQVRLTVADNGRGFSSGVHTEEMDGVANMRARIEKLGGRFEIASEAGQGTTVRFYMPLSS